MHSQAKAPPVQTGRTEETVDPATAKSYAEADHLRVNRDSESRLSPAYLKPDEGIWEQTYLSKALQNMKDSEVPKLRLPPTCYKPQEYEKWIMNLNTTMKGLHPEIGHY